MGEGSTGTVIKNKTRSEEAGYRKGQLSGFKLVHNEVKCGREEAEGTGRWWGRVGKNFIPSTMAHMHVCCRGSSPGESGRWPWGELRIETYVLFVGDKTIHIVRRQAL